LAINSEKQCSISVVIAAHNSEAEIRILFDSLCTSEYADFDVCVCNDASTDRTLDVIKSYAGRLNLKVVSNANNLGVTTSRNKALSLATAPLLLFLDSDVRLAPDTIGRLVAGRQQTNADVYEGIYTPIALDAGFCSAYYALFAHQSFLGVTEPAPYNVFNAWCALCRREVMDALGGHHEIPQGMEVENESLGRRIVAGGFKLILDPAIGVDHHWGGPRKLLYVATSRIYWWVKVYFAADREFENCMTTSSYGIATLCLPLAAVLAVLGFWFWWSFLPAGLCLLGFLAGYFPLYRFIWLKKGALFLLGSIVLSMGMALIISVSAVYSGLEELLRRAFTGRYTLAPDSFSA